MKKWVLVILAMAMVAAAAGRFIIEGQVKALDSKLAKQNRDIAAERQQIALLKAEWSHLTEAPRLTQLAQQFAPALQLHPVRPGQLLNLSDYRRRFDPDLMAALSPPLPARKPGSSPLQKPAATQLATTASAPSAVHEPEVPPTPRRHPRPLITAPEPAPAQPLNPAAERQIAEITADTALPPPSDGGGVEAPTAATPKPSTRPTLAMILGNLRMRKQ